MALIRNLIVNVYYVIYMTMEQWMNPISVVLFILSGVLGWRNSMKGKKSTHWQPVLCCLSVILYLGISVWSFTGNVEKAGMINKGLQIFYYVGASFLFYCLGNCIGRKLTSTRAEKLEAEDGFWKKLKYMFMMLYFGGWIPLGLIATYIYPKADDYSFGYHAHRAWEQTGSVWEVLKAAMVMIEEAWFDWQGTYSSIFFMALQPAVFDEKLYAIVPFLFVGMITAASYFLMKTVLRDWLHADKVLSQICIWSYLLLVIQRVPDPQSAFIWYNGATHYITSHCAMLCAIAFTVRGSFVLQKETDSLVKRYSTWMLAVAFTVYVGGGNYVTAVGALLICLTVLLMICLTKSWKKYKGVIGICIVYFLAMTLNFIAPGNFTRKGRFEGYSIVSAFFMAFVESIEHMLGVWMHWTILLFILVMLPILWRIVSKTEFEFKSPGIILVYSWCYMAALFFAPLYTLGEVNVGRFQNVMYLQWILILLFDVLYVMGWMQRKYSVVVKSVPSQSEKKGIGVVLVFSFVCLMLSILAEPQKYTSVYAFHTFMDPELETYAEEYWEMVEILNGDEKVVEIKDFSYIPPFFDVSLRHEGLKLFYSKEEVRIK